MEKSSATGWHVYGTIRGTGTSAHPTIARPFPWHQCRRSEYPRGSGRRKAPPYPQRRICRGSTVRGERTGYQWAGGRERTIPAHRPNSAAHTGQKVGGPQCVMDSWPPCARVATKPQYLAPGRGRSKKADGQSTTKKLRSSQYISRRKVR